MEEELHQQHVVVHPGQLNSYYSLDTMQDAHPKSSFLKKTITILNIKIYKRHSLKV